MKVFKVKKDLVFTSTLMFFILFSLQFVIVIFSGNDLEHLIYASLLLYGQGIFLLFMIINTRIVIKDNKISSIILFFSRKTCEIRSIQSIKQERHFVGAFRRMLITYRNAKGKKKTAGLGIDAYEIFDLKEILKVLIEVNPDIKLDKHIQELLIS